ncbi:MAG: wax ester/triacylglycerol synthase family O-acyltransferase [Actinomycetota bacterium]|jgi:WS/DGAT/MGAT family acyltransferase|nr:wax ester/triacylglycerol synthase family O-acyltransferase [Actinomycetota bacterium]
MRRLAGEDAGFLLMELPVQPMNTQGLAIVRPAVGPDGVPVPLTPSDLHRHVTRRLGELPSFRWRVVPVPFGVGQPVYVEDPQFDVTDHLRHVTLPHPGGSAQLDALFAALGEHPLDRRHPLWQLVLVDGLADGRQAVIVRYNHCMADGVAAVTTFSRLCTGADHVPDPPAEPWQGEPIPTRSRLVAGALVDHARRLRALPLLAAETWRAARAARAAAPGTVPDVPADTPACILNDAFTVARSYGRARLPMDRVRMVKEAAGVRVNDVALAVVGGALRRYLADTGELPDRPLTASVPVAFEPAGAAPRQWGNRFSALTTSLATDVADPWQRLARIGATTRAAKERFALARGDLMPDWLEYVPPFVAGPAVRALHRAMAEGRRKPDVNVLVSNIRGPDERWSFHTAVVEELYLSGPPSNGVGLNVMIWSYAGDLVFSVLSFADALRRPAALEEALVAALDELVASVPRKPVNRRDGPTS